jgi:hypothetical protein
MLCKACCASEAPCPDSFKSRLRAAFLWGWIATSASGRLAMTGARHCERSEAIQKLKLTKTAVAERMNTSRRLLDPNTASVTLSTLQIALI